jgi:hypothetical protein
MTANIVLSLVFDPGAGSPGRLFDSPELADFAALLSAKLKRRGFSRAGRAGI